MHQHSDVNVLVDTTSKSKVCRLSYDLHSSGMNLIVPKARTNYFRNSFASAGAKLWNSLPSSLKEETSLKQFKAKIRSYLLSTQAS